MRTKFTRYKAYCMLVLGLCMCSALHAQQYAHNPVAQYYRNGYLWNPAYAGSKDHASIYALLNNSWIGFDGAPRLIVLSGDKAFGKNAGAGARIVSEKSGFLQRTNILLDYSYTLPFSSDTRLRLGISGGGFWEQYRSTDGSGMSDPLVSSFNENKMVVDGSLGGVYESRQFSFGAAWYNLRSSFQKNNTIETDIAKANLMASWDFIIASADSTSIKPMVGYKFFSGGNGLFTMGVQLERSKIFSTSILWQSSGSVIGSVGLRIANIAEVNFSYASNNKYGYGQLYEIGLGVGLH